MFDPETIDLIQRAPPLEGLDLTALPQILTEAFATVVAARIRLRTGSPDPEGTEVTETLKLLTRLAATHEIYVALMPDRENRAAAAFVAASAHQARRLARVGTQSSSRISITSISSEISASLLFLIAEAYPDAAEAAKRIVFDDVSIGPIERALLVALRKLAEGRLAEIISDPLPEAVAIAPEDRALEALLDLLLSGVHALARQLRNTRRADGLAGAHHIFQRVKRLCIDEITDPFGDGRAAFSVFSGPLHLANLLISAEKDMSAAALAHLPAPTGIDPAGWAGILRRMVRSRPFLWQNHRVAIEKGFLEPGQSAAISFPTGAGKSTLSELKIAAALLQNKQIVFLAPTHALVSQTAKALQRTFRDASVIGDIDDEAAISVELELPEIVVTTPERCLMLLSMQPEAFVDLGLIVFDECHLMHARPDDRSRRGLDSMLCLLQLTQAAPQADLLLLSAMMKNTAELSGWLKTLTNRDCLALDLAWKPTRQARGCVVYDMSRLNELGGRLTAARVAKPSQKAVPAAVKRGLSAIPFGFFGLRQTWNSTKHEDYTLRALIESPTLLSASTGARWYLTPNGNEVSTSIASGSVGAGMKTLVFVQSTTACTKCVRDFVEHLTPQEVTLTEEEAAWRRLAVEEMGGPQYCYLTVDDDGKVRTGAASHHALLLATERELHESLFKRKDGIYALFATSTLAQGMNLPSEVVIICGDSRFDSKADKLKQLEAHELLNAAGRAGRAGEGSQGFVLLVPSHVIGFDQAKSVVGKDWMDLQAIFGQSDQCLVIEDPMEAALDDIHNGITLTGSAAYLLGRLPVAKADGGPDPAEIMLKRSFVAYSKTRAGDSAWLLSRTAAAVAARPAASAFEVSWLSATAASTGLSTELLESLLHLVDSGALVGSAPQIMVSLLAWVQQTPRRLMDLVRPEGLEGLFGDAYKKLATDDERAVQALELIAKILPIWMSGRPLCDIEAVVEGRPTKLGFCVTARHFATRVAPDLAFVASLPARLLLNRLAAISPDDKPEIPTVLATLSSILREGCDCPEALAVRLEAGRTVSRVAARRQYESALPHLTGSTINEPFEQTRMRVRNAMALASFLDFDAGSSNSSMTIQVDTDD
ncbi:DEAD/DEAH box helicase [Aureimonas psammosilenae]|uniref:DEAD/DEAH box helicase n=1 Tax=Aureimonas psammosilenae TaxID=2495496 RepID=UPI001260AF94|nr:DEAD/DEAH box helicase [Aureimonas psammosilenae]